MPTAKANWAIGIAVQCVTWFLSSLVTVFLLPFLVVFWPWSVVTDYTGTVKKKKRTSSKGWLASRGLGKSHFVQLKVLPLFSIYYYIMTRNKAKINDKIIPFFEPVVKILIKTRTSAFIILRVAARHDR